MLSSIYMCSWEFKQNFYPNFLWKFLLCLLFIICIYCFIIIIFFLVSSEQMKENKYESKKK